MPLQNNKAKLQIFACFYLPNPFPFPGWKDRVDPELFSEGMHHNKMHMNTSNYEKTRKFFQEGM